MLSRSVNTHKRGIRVLVEQATRSVSSFPSVLLCIATFIALVPADVDLFCSSSMLRPHISAYTLRSASVSRLGYRNRCPVEKVIGSLDIASGRSEKRRRLKGAELVGNGMTLSARARLLKYRRGRCFCGPFREVSRPRRPRVQPTIATYGCRRQPCIETR